jgi:ActR/RegA family two-component response regulator
MTDFFQNGIEIFKKHVNLLIVDDEANLRDALLDVFVSPLFNITTASTLSESATAIGKVTVPWHCWIVDIDLGHGQCGLDLLSNHPNFPYVVVLSGLHRMALAAEAIRLGARIALDKDPSSIDRLHDEVCKTAALGFLLKGKPCADMELFQLLQDPSIMSIEEWANRACITLRKLHRIFDRYAPLTPHFALALYRTVYYLLQNPDPVSGATKALVESPSGYGSWIEYTVKKYSALQEHEGGG